MFIDLGCGKGKPLLVAAGLPFQRLIGVDISQACITIARRNVQVYGPERIDPSRVELLTMDVEDFVFPDAPMVIYLFNPFPAKLMARVMANLEQSLRESPRNAVIVYVNPEALEAVERSEFFVRIPTCGDWAPRNEWAAIFATRPADWAWPRPPTGVRADELGRRI